MNFTTIKDDIESEELSCRKVLNNLKEIKNAFTLINTDGFGGIFDLDVSLDDIKNFIFALAPENVATYKARMDFLRLKLFKFAMYANEGIEICEKFALDEFIKGNWREIGSGACGLKFLKWAHELTGMKMTFASTLWLSTLRPTMDLSKIIEYLKERYLLDEKNVTPLCMVTRGCIGKSERNKLTKKIISLIEKHDIPIHPDSLEMYNVRRLEVLSVGTENLVKETGFTWSVHPGDAPASLYGVYIDPKMTREEIPRERSYNEMLDVTGKIEIQYDFDGRTKHVWSDFNETNLENVSDIGKFAIWSPEHPYVVLYEGLPRICLTVSDFKQVIIDQVERSTTHFEQFFPCSLVLEGVEVFDPKDTDSATLFVPRWKA